MCVKIKNLIQRLIRGLRRELSPPKILGTIALAATVLIISNFWMLRHDRQETADLDLWTIHPKYEEEYDSLDKISSQRHALLSVNCSSPERYSGSIAASLQAKGQRIVYVTAKFGHNQRFCNDISKRLQQAVGTFPWLDPENAYAYCEFPEHWRMHAPYVNHVQFLTDPNHESAVGGGWWFWKAPLILDHLRQLQDGDLLIYADFDQITWWTALTDLVHLFVENPSIDWALPQWRGGSEGAYTKRDVIHAYCGHLNSTEFQEAINSAQWEAGIQIFRKTHRVVKHVEQWQRANENYHAISDDASYLLPNFPSFLEHRRDQSLLNMLLKCRYCNNNENRCKRSKAWKYTTIDVPHPCGWLYGQNMIDFHVVSFAPRNKKTNLDLLQMEQQTNTAWEMLSRYHATDPLSNYTTDILNDLSRLFQSPE